MILFAAAVAAPPAWAGQGNGQGKGQESRQGKGQGNGDGNGQGNQQQQVDTEHLFGFSEGAETGQKGEQEVVLDTVTRIGKRRAGPGPSAFWVLDTKLGYQFDPTDGFSIELGVFGDLRRVRNIADLDDKAFGTFDGVSVELKHQFLHASAEQPVGLALELRPRFVRVLPVEGNGANVFDMESLLQLDVQVVPDRLWYGANVSFEPAAGRRRGSGEGFRSSTFLISQAFVARIAEKTFLGPEIRYLRGYDGTFLNRLQSEALTLGPAFHRRFTEKTWLTLAYAGQVWGRDTDRAYARRAFGLTQFERHALRVKVGVEF